MTSKKSDVLLGKPVPISRDYPIPQPSEDAGSLALALACSFIGGRIDLRWRAQRSGKNRAYPR